MQLKTMALLYRVACGRLLGDYGTIAIYHIGYAMTEKVLHPNDFDIDYYPTWHWHIAEAKRIFRKAKNLGSLK